MKSIILFGHDARHSRWREPFDRLVSLWRAQHTKMRVEAFLELMQPSFLSGSLSKNLKRIFSWLQ